MRKLLQRWFAARPESATAVALRVEWPAWRAPPAHARLEDIRWIVVDTETSGLDPKRDRLLSIGAVSIEAGAIRLADSVEVFLRQERPSALDNVLVHGIGYHAQASGQPVERCLGAFLRLARRDVLVGYHTLFDVVILRRALKAHLGIDYRPAHLDLALLLPALFREPFEENRDLDRWAARFRLHTPSRHSALADAITTAELLLVALHRAGQENLQTLPDLLRAQRLRLDALHRSSQSQTAL